MLCIFCTLWTGAWLVAKSALTLCCRCGLPPWVWFHRHAGSCWLTGHYHILCWRLPRHLTSILYVAQGHQH